MAAALPITAIIVTYNSSALLEACIVALLEEGAQVIVVDNGSTDGSSDIAEAFGVRVIRNEKNLGYGKANNIGCRAADTDYILICNPDAIVKKGALATMLSVAKAKSVAGLVGPKLINTQGQIVHKTRSMLSQKRTDYGVLPVESSQVPFLIGACYLVERTTFLDIGGFDENIFVYYEDDDLCRRLNDQNRPILYAQDAEVVHHLGASTKPDASLIRFVRFHQAWSKAYVARKYKLPSPIPNLLISNGIKYLFSRLIGNRRREDRYLSAWTGAVYFLLGKPPISSF